MNFINTDGWNRTYLRTERHLFGCVDIYSITLKEPPLQWTEKGRIFEMCEGCKISRFRFLSDGGSGPWDNEDKQRWEYAQAYIWHDFIYRFGYYYEILDGKYKRVYVSRKEADQLLYKMLIVLGSSILWADTVYTAVRAFGWINWHPHYKELKEMILGGRSE